MEGKQIDLTSAGPCFFAFASSEKVRTGGDSLRNSPESNRPVGRRVGPSKTTIENSRSTANRCETFAFGLQRAGSKRHFADRSICFPLLRLGREYSPAQSTLPGASLGRTHSELNEERRVFLLVSQIFLFHWIKRIFSVRITRRTNRKDPSLQLISIFLSFCQNVEISCVIDLIMMIRYQWSPNSYKWSRSSLILTLHNGIS